MKDRLKYILQKALGYNLYLYAFAIFKIRTLKMDSKENDFFCFLKLIRDDRGAILDIGANIGIMSYHLSKRFPNTTIHAYEPMPSNNEILAKIISKFNLSNIQLNPIALGKKKGIIQMILPQKDKVIYQGLSHVKHKSIPDMNTGFEFDIPMDSLDNLLKHEKIQALKIDVENFEYFVLKGGKKLLKSNKPIIYAELWDNKNRKKCFNLLKSMDYSTFVVVKNELHPYNQVIHDKQNFIFVPR